MQQPAGILDTRSMPVTQSPEIYPDTRGCMSFILIVKSIFGI